MEIDKITIMEWKYCQGCDVYPDGCKDCCVAEEKEKGKKMECKGGENSGKGN